MDLYELDLKPKLVSKLEIQFLDLTYTPSKLFVNPYKSLATSTIIYCYHICGCLNMAYATSKCKI